MRERRRITVQGIVQGVGFRPFVYGLAARHALGGHVRNDAAGVTIEVEGDPAALEAFVRAVRYEPPPLARVERVAWESLPLHGDMTFVIAASQDGAARQTLIAPDVAPCADCLRELFDPADRRYHYPFINCTNCGPRFTIIRDVPYDRHQTTMAGFPLCPTCRREYDDPADRRFHAQPNACPTCGPILDFGFWILDYADEKSIQNPKSKIQNPLALAAQQLAAGAVLAIKGLGGYHLACDARQAAAVARLRLRKHREAKPFAVMVADLATARQLCRVSDVEAALLESRRRPIVLLAQRPGGPVAPAVAPDHTTLGVMLPYTPLHHLLLRAFAAATAACPAALVLTSGNRSEEPIAYRDDDAQERLAAIADGALTHNRPIHIRCDDSVARIAAGGEQILRRARGYAPEPFSLAFTSPEPLLACGGHLKNTFCLVKNQQAFVSHHIGDLENVETLTAFREGIAHYGRLFDIQPTVVAYDLHPDYLATQYARDLDVPQKIGVQHHHAHIASVLAEHGLAGPVIGVAADGTGYGSDGAVWGCEIMAADLRGFARLAHLAYVPLPGGEQAVRQPWRMAAVYLAQAYGDGFLDLDLPFVRRLDRARWRPLTQMIARGLNSPPASSLGRLFDAVAALLGLRDAVLYEGQAAIELEMLAAPSTQVYPFALGVGGWGLGVGDEGSGIRDQGSGISDSDEASPPIIQNPKSKIQNPKSPAPAQLDVTPMIRAIVEDIQQGVPTAEIAGRFHRTVAELLAAACGQARAHTGLRDVALSGGVFQNRLLLEQLVARLAELDFQVYLNRRVPPNDGGLSLGQAAVAAAQLYGG